MLNRRRALVGFSSIVGGLLGIRGSAHANREQAVTRIGFGSCMHQDKSQAVWNTISAKHPDHFIMMGDGVYPDEDGDIIAALDRAYETASSIPELKSFRNQVPVSAIWDDNDYGGADIGNEFAHKVKSRDRFLAFWESEAGQQRRRRDSGIYDVIELGHESQRVQIILLDLRYCRTPWRRHSQADVEALSKSNFGPFQTVDDPSATMLGETQWRWLESVLRRPARVRLLVSSIQFLSNRGWESWSNFPHEKQRLYDLIQKTDAGGIVILSGDAHFGEISRLRETSFGYPLWEITSSGLTESWPDPGPNPYRLGEPVRETNFGLLHINWRSRDPLLVFEIHSTSGKRPAQRSTYLSMIQW